MQNELVECIAKLSDQLKEKDEKIKEKDEKIKELELRCQNYHDFIVLACKEFEKFYKQ